MLNEKGRYIANRIFVGFLWLMAIAILYILSKRFLAIDYLSFLGPFFDNRFFIVFVFFLSELIVGLIPPEIFIIWALRSGQLVDYLLLIGVLATLSYAVGVVGYFIGHYLNRSVLFRFIKQRFFKKLDRRLKDFGIYLILIAAMTPLPFSGVCMLIGSGKFPFRRFLLLSLSRFLRFFLYAYFFWKINPLP